MSVFTTETSTRTAVPPLPALSVLLARFESVSAGVGVALLSKAPPAAVVVVTLAPAARLGMVHGRAEQPPPVTFVIVMFVGVSVTWMLVAIEVPALATTRV